MLKPQKKRALYITGVACLLPPLAITLFEPSLSFLIAPFIFVASLVFATIAWLLLAQFRVPVIKRSYLIATALTVVATWIAWTCYHARSPQGRFERLMQQPIPKNIGLEKSDGHVSLAGGSEQMVFTIPAQDLEGLTQKSGLNQLPADADIAELISTDHLMQINQSSKDNLVDPFYYYFDGDYSSFRILVVNKARNRAYFYRFRL